MSAVPREDAWAWLDRWDEASQCWCYRLARWTFYFLIFEFGRWVGT